MVEVSEVSVQVSGLGSFLLTPDTRNLKPDLEVRGSRFFAIGEEIPIIFVPESWFRLRVLVRCRYRYRNRYRWLPVGFFSETRYRFRFRPRCPGGFWCRGSGVRIGGNLSSRFPWDQRFGVLGSGFWVLGSGFGVERVSGFGCQGSEGKKSAFRSQKSESGSPRSLTP